MSQREKIMKGVKEFSPDEIKKLRERLGATQEVFADIVGVGKIQVSRWENDNARPRNIARREMQRIENELDEIEND